MSNIRDYSLLVEGLTQHDVDFREAITELGGYADFFNLKRSAMNKLNHHMVGSKITANEPVRIAAILDFQTNLLILNGGEIPLDELDPALINHVNMVSTNVGRKNERVPLSELSLELLHEYFPDSVEFETRVDVNDNMSRELLQRAFENEMLLLVQLDEYIKDNGLESIMDGHKDELIELVGSHAFDHNFTEAVEELTTEFELRNSDKAMAMG